MIEHQGNLDEPLHELRVFQFLEFFKCFRCRTFTGTHLRFELKWERKMLGWRLPKLWAIGIRQY